jgi:tetratricopeptide (TPR) repeat protein
MMTSSYLFRSVLLAGAAFVLPVSQAGAGEPVQIVFQNGRSVPITAVALQGDTLTITAEFETFTVGQVFPLAIADHIYGEKPVAVNQGIALLLMGNPVEALKLLEPVLAAQQITARIPGNFWLEAARASLIAHAVNGNSAKCTELGKAISDSTPAQGSDPIVALGKVLLMSSSERVEDKEVALRDLATGNSPADVAAYATFYRGNLLQTANRDAEALESYLMVTGLYPSGCLIINGAAGLNASKLLVALGRRKEADILLKDSARDAVNTLVATEANKFLETLK